MISQTISNILDKKINCLDLLPYEHTLEKLLSLALNGQPAGLPPELGDIFSGLLNELDGCDTSEVKLLIIGGGTGLSNVIGGDSRQSGWAEKPFSGLKSVFPRTNAVVCVTDDGGSTGELLKDLPLIALGDLRHVLLSSITLSELAARYQLDEKTAYRCAANLHRLFNYRGRNWGRGKEKIFAACGVDIAELPKGLGEGIARLLDLISKGLLGSEPLAREHCLGNLLLAAAIYMADEELPPAGSAIDYDKENNSEREQTENRLVTGGDGRVRYCSCPRTPKPAAILAGLSYMERLLGAGEQAVLPCSCVPAKIKVLYDNGVLVSGESKSSEAQRACPVDRVMVEFVKQPELHPRLDRAIAEADIILFAPGSLFSSIIPVLQVPGLADAIRKNKNALKLLIANLWVQSGETDLVKDAGERRFHVSDLLNAYGRNIPGGVAGLFDKVMVVGMREVSAGILQSYALENKMPIYLDRKKVHSQGVSPLEAAIASSYLLAGRPVLQHDPTAVAKAVRLVWALKDFKYPEDEAARGETEPGALSEEDGLMLPMPKKSSESAEGDFPVKLNPKAQTPDKRRREFIEKLSGLKIGLFPQWQAMLEDIFWRHSDIAIEHLGQLAGISLVPREDWQRCQIWDRLYSFYDPLDRMIKMRADIAGGSSLDNLAGRNRFELAFLVALGQSLLGDYAEEKKRKPVMVDGEEVGYIFSLRLRDKDSRSCYLGDRALKKYLQLSRMRMTGDSKDTFTRLVNSDEGFTPPGLLFGLTYAWYLDNRFAPHVEYKMSITRAPKSTLIPEQVKIAKRRQALTDFFREEVFGN